MAGYVAVDKDGDEYIYRNKPKRGHQAWVICQVESDVIPLPKGSIEKLIGRKLTWEDEPVELKEE